jgi:hypothetical protein
MTFKLDIRSEIKPIAADTLASSVAVSGALMLGSLIESGSPWAPFNAICHMTDGDDREFGDDFHPRDTMLGMALNVSALLSWAVLYRMALRVSKLRRSILTGAALALAAYIVDYYVVPKRFTPGIEKKLSWKSIAGAYCALALSLAIRPAVAND